jgi:hypothetical protein
VTYTTGVSYGYTDNGTAQSPIAMVRKEVHQSIFHKQIGFTQVLSVIPGLQRLDVKMNQKAFFNLLNPDLGECTNTPTAEPLLSRREWLAYEDASPINWTDNRGNPMQDIDNAIERWLYDITNGSLQMNGLTTRFTTSTNGFDTNLIITFKFGLQYITHLASWFDESEFDDSPEKTTITFYWYLCTYEAVIANRDFFWLNPSTELWEYVVDGDEQTNFNTFEITAADLDSDLLTYTATLKIPIGELVAVSSGDPNDLDLVFRMGTEEVDKAGESAAPASKCYYGDFRASVSGDPENNLLRGDITTDFLNKMTIEMDLFDSGWNFRNGLIRPTGVNYLTQLWTYGGAGGNEELSKILLKSKFRLYRIARQKIEMTVQLNSLPNMTLLWAWQDGKQSNKVFILLSYTHRPQSDMYDLILYEWDGDEVINLV